MNITHLKIEKDKEILSPAQKTFNRLNTRIAKIKKDIEKIPVKIEFIRNFQQENMAPLSKKWQTVRFETIKKLDYFYAITKLTAKQKENLAAVIMEEAENFRTDFPDSESLAEMETIADKYTNMLYSEDELKAMKTEEMEMLKNITENIFGVDMDGFEDVPEEEHDDFFRRKMEEKFNQQAAEEENDRNYQWQQGNTRKSKKTAKQLKEDAKKVETDASLKTLREVYTDLVKKLHPDREKDETLRLEKTEQMKQVTEAYEKKDLATLLIMQITWLQNTDKDPKSQPDEVLARYNNVLKMHIKKLEEEYHCLVQRPLPFDTGFDSFYLLLVNERDMQSRLAMYKNNMLFDIFHAEEVFSKIHSATGLKSYIKDYMKSDELLGSDMLMNMLFR